MFLTAFIQLLNGVKTALIDLNGDGTPDCSAERFGSYGLLSKPLPKTRALTLRKNQKLVIISEQNDFPNIEIQLADGDVALTDGTQKIHIKKSGGIEITGGNITISGAQITLGGDGAKKLVTESFIPLFLSHIHGSPAGATTAPLFQFPSESVTTKILSAT